MKIKNDRSRRAGRFLLDLFVFDKSKQVPLQITQLILVRSDNELLL